MINENESLIRELEDSTQTLLEALRSRDPQYLEQLERRQRVVTQLAAKRAASCDAADLLRLSAALQMGAEATAEVRHMQEAAQRELRSLEPQRRLAGALEAQSGARRSFIDLKL